MAEDEIFHNDQCFESLGDSIYRDGDQLVLDDDITFEVLADKLCALRITGTTVPVVTPLLLNAIRSTNIPCMQNGGVLLDVQAVPHLSVVRLASFLDSLIPLVSMVAVLFRDKEQSHLARLLHNTLVDKESIAYFTDSRAAFMFLALAI